MSKKEKRPQAPLTREQELETENVQLKLENACVEILKVWVEEKGKSAEKIR